MIGVDIVEIERIERAVKKFGRHFLERVFTKNELKKCLARNKTKFPELAARFAAKEAVSKAFGTGKYGLVWTEIEVVNNRLGKPEIVLSGAALKRFKKQKIKEILVTLSHSRKYSVAFVLMKK